MAMSSHGGVLADRASKALAKAPHTLHRSPLNRRLVRPWSMDSARSRSLSRAPALVVRPPFGRYRTLASQSPQLLTLHLFRTMVADRPSGVAYNALCA